VAGRVVVVGGGITGLAAAHALGEALPADVEVLVLEGSPAVGGKLRLGEVAGLVVDLGAEAMLNRRPEAVDLARRVGLGDDLVHPEPVGSAIWTRDAVRPMPRTVMGVPGDLDGLARSGILSRAGLARARMEPWLPGAVLDPEETDDVSVGVLVTRRFGAEVADRLVEPLLGGVYAGHARELSLAAAAPQVARLAEQDRSLTWAAQASLARSGGTAQAAQEPVFAGLRGGVGRLPQAVADTARATVRTGVTVRELHRHAGGWRLVAGSTHDAEEILADAVVLATPAAPTARLLESVAPEAAAPLRRIEYASMAVVSLAYPVSAATRRLTGSGLLVPPVDDRMIKAATFSTNKWGWLAQQAADASVVVLRASIGRHRQEHLLQRDDSELVWAAAGDLEEATGLRGQLADAHVMRWGGGLPQYTVGHVGRVRRIRSAVDAVEGLAVCGAAYDGVGIAACVADGRRAATRIVERWGRGGE
jgi:oxygen-dependent protoporphyrinogen oxidase